MPSERHCGIIGGNLLHNRYFLCKQYTVIMFIYFDRCIKTFEVEYSSKSDTGPFERINTEDTIFANYVYTPRTHSQDQGKVPGTFNVLRIKTDR